MHMRYRYADRLRHGEVTMKWEYQCVPPVLTWENTLKHIFPPHFAARRTISKG